MSERVAPVTVVNIGTHSGVRPKGASIPSAAAKAGPHHATRLLALALLVAALVANDYLTGEIVIADGGLNLT